MSLSLKFLYFDNNCTYVYYVFEVYDNFYFKIGWINLPKPTFVLTGIKDDCGEVSPEP